MSTSSLYGVCAALLLIIITSGCAASAGTTSDGNGSQQSDTLRTGIHLGHSVRVIAVSPDGKTFATGGSDNTVRLWDAASARELRILRGHTKPLQALTFGPEGKQLFSIGIDDTIIRWDATTGKELSRKQFNDFDVFGGESIAVSADGKTVVVGEDGDVRFLDAATLSETGKMRMASPGRVHVALSPDGKSFAAGNNEIQIFDLASAKELHKITHKGGVSGLAFAPDGTIVATYPEESLAKVWNVASGKELRSLSVIQKPDELPMGNFDTMSLSFDGKLLATAGGDGVVRIWDVASGKQVKSVDQKAAVAILRFNSAGKTLIGLAGTPLSVATDKLVIWDQNSWKTIHTIEPHTSGILNAALSPNGKVLATVSPVSGTFLKLWDLSSGKNFVSTSGDPILEQYDLTFSADNKLVAATYGSNIKLFDAVTGKVLRTIEFAHGDRAVQSVAFSPDGKLLATGGANPKPMTGAPNRTVRIWDVATGKRVQELQPGHEDPIIAIEYSMDGKTLASAGGHEVKIWDTATGKSTQSLASNRDFTCLSFSPDGTMIATADMQGSVKLWNPKSAKELHAMSIEGNTFSVAFSHDGKMLATSGGALKLWNTSNGQELRTLPGHEGYVRFVSFSPDDRRLISASADGTVRIWETQSGKELASLYPVDKNDWIAVTPDGNFDTSENASKYLDDTFKKANRQTGILSKFLGPKESSKTASE